MFKVTTIFANMKILICSATEEELINLREIEVNSQEIDFLVSGVGMVSTAYSLTRQLSAADYDLVINIGLAGSFRKDIAIGTVLRIEEDYFSEIGAEDGENFLTLEEMSLKGETYIQNEIDFDSDMLNALPVFKGITVNTVHGNEISIEKIKQRLQPDVETMESAAFLWIGKKEKIPALQIRSISNYVERRNRAEWNIPLAIQNLHKIVSKILHQLPI